MRVDHPPADTSSTHSRMPRRLRWLFEAALFAAVVAGIGFWQTRHVPSGAAPDFAAPLATPAGTTTTLDAFRAAHAGRPVLIYFWADWCPICKITSGSVNSIAAEHPVLGIAMQSGGAAEVARFIAAQGHAGATVVDPEGRIAAAYGVSGVPAFVVVDAMGRIRFAERGYTSNAGLRLRLWWAGVRPA